MHGFRDAVGDMTFGNNACTTHPDLAFLARFPRKVNPNQ